MVSRTGQGGGWCRVGGGVAMAAAVVALGWAAPTEAAAQDTRQAVGAEAWLGLGAAWLGTVAIAVAAVALAMRKRMRQQVRAHLDAHEQQRHITRQREDTIKGLQSMVRAMPIGCLRFDKDHRLEELNPAAAQLIGLSPEAARGRKPSELFEQTSQTLQSILDREAPATATVSLTTLDGRQRMCQWHNTPLTDATGNLIGTLCMVEDVTDRHQAQQALRQSEERFQAFMTFSPMIAWMKDPTGRYVFVNEQHMRIHNLTREQVIGRTDAEVWPEDVARELRANDAAVIASREVQEMIEQVPDGNGRRHDYLTFKFPVFMSETEPYIGGIAIDITERKRIEEELRRSEQRLTVALDALEGGTWDWDIAGGKLVFTDGWARMRGYRPDEIVPSYEAWEGSLHPEDRAATQAALDDYLAGRTSMYRSEHRLRTKQGHYIWVLDRGQVVAWDSDGRPTRMIGTELDITVRKEREELLRRQQELARQELEKLKSELVSQTRLAAIGQISASIAHELRNPLGTIRNAHYYLKRRADLPPEKWQQYMSMIEQEVNTADRIISDLMEMSRAKEPLRQQVDVATVAREAMERCAAGPSVTLEIETDGTDGMVWADAGQLRQVLSNLFTNAAQAMEGCGRVRLAVGREEDCDIITVRDDGPGIDPAIRLRVFEPLFTTRAKGTGLGLAICRQIVEQHGGRIDLMTTASGAAFVLRLPRKSTPESRITP